MLADPLYDPEKGTVTYFDRSQGDALRASWIDEHVLPAFTQARERHPAIRSGAVIGFEGGSFSKPLMYDTINVLLLLSELDETDIDAALRPRFASDTEGIRPADLVNWAVPTHTTGTGWHDEILIPMFASRCPAAVPGRAFNDPPPYGVLGRLRVDGGIVRFDSVATALRPWLDGVRSVDYPGTWEFDPADGPRLREAFLRDVITPIVEEQFSKQSALRSCVMGLAQYWDDNAHDEVEVTFVFSELDTPDLAAENAWYNTTDPINRPNVRPGRAVSLPRGFAYLTLIPLFAAFCPGGATQDDDPDQAYAPYAVFRRHKDGVEIETIGQPLRPWLEGRRVEVWAD